MRYAKKPRRIVVENRVFLWLVKHEHHVVGPRCREVFTAYRQGIKHGALRIELTESEGQHAGYPEAGVVWTADLRVNLNEPKIAAALIRAALAQGWTEEARAPCLTSRSRTNWASPCAR